MGIRWLNVKHWVNIVLLSGCGTLELCEHCYIKVKFLAPNTILLLEQEVICLKVSVLQASVLMNGGRDGRYSPLTAALRWRRHYKVDNESKRRVICYWKQYNIRQAIWFNDVLLKEHHTATINHAWHNILEGLPEDQQHAVPGVWQSAEEEVQAAAGGQTNPRAEVFNIFLPTYPFGYF